MSDRLILQNIRYSQVFNQRAKVGRIIQQEV